MGKTESSSDSEEEYKDEQYHPHNIEKKGDKLSNDLVFNAFDRHKKKHTHWIFQDDDIRTIPHSRARSKLSMNNVSATECNTMSDSHILFKSILEGELENR